MRTDEPVVQGGGRKAKCCILGCRKNPLGYYNRAFAPRTRRPCAAVLETGGEKRHAPASPRPSHHLSPAQRARASPSAPQQLHQHCTRPSIQCAQYPVRPPPTHLHLRAHTTPRPTFAPLTTGLGRDGPQSEIKSRPQHDTTPGCFTSQQHGSQQGTARSSTTSNITNGATIARESTPRARF